MPTSQKRKPSARPVAIVTGGGRRLGRQICLALGRSGFDLVVNYHSSKSGAQKTVNLLAASGCNAISCRADVSNRAQVTGMVRETMRKFGRVDLLVNSAAVFIDSPLDRTSEKNWNTTIDINLKGPFLCSQAVAPIMLNQKRGRIINIASLGGVQAWKQHLPYSVSKAGVIMLTKVLAKSLAPHIMVNAIAPGTIIMEHEEDPKISHIPQERIPLGRYGKPSDITNAVLFLAKTSTYMTGQLLVIDGGRSIQ